MSADRRYASRYERLPMGRKHLMQGVREDPRARLIGIPGSKGESQVEFRDPEEVERDILARQAEADGIRDCGLILREEGGHGLSPAMRPGYSETPHGRRLGSHDRGDKT